MNEMIHEHHEGSCPGSRMMQFHKEDEQTQEAVPAANGGRTVSQLNQWPCQIKLLLTQAPFFDGAKLLIAAD